MGNRDRADVSQGLADLLRTGGDLLGSVIQSDRRRGGRDLETPAEAGSIVLDAEDRPTASEPAGTSVSGQYDKKAAKHRDKSARRPAAPPARPSARRLTRTGIAGGRPATEIEPPPGILEGRIAEARAMASGATTTVTLRIPREFNDWLDEYVHRSWPQRVRKQELVGEALRLLFARRGRAGEPVLDTDLLPRDTS